MKSRTKGGEVKKNTSKLTSSANILIYTRACWFGHIGAVKGFWAWCTITTTVALQSLSGDGTGSNKQKQLQ